VNLDDVKEKKGNLKMNEKNHQLIEHIFQGVVRMESNYHLLFFLKIIVEKKKEKEKKRFN